MRHMVYYTRGNIIYFVITTESGESYASGSDKEARLHEIADCYNVSTIERLD